MMKKILTHNALRIVLFLTVIPCFCADKKSEHNASVQTAKKELVQKIHEFTTNIEHNTNNIDSFTRPMLAQKRLAASDIADEIINKKLVGPAINFTFACYNNDLAFRPDTANHMDVFLKNQSDFYQQRKNGYEGKKKPYQQPKYFIKLEQAIQKDFALIQKIFSARQLIAKALTRVAPAPQQHAEQKSATPVRVIKILQRPSQNPKTTP